MKYSVEQVLEALAIDEVKYPSDKTDEEIADLHCGLADMVAEGKIEMAFDEQNGRPMFKAPSVKNFVRDLPMPPEMLN